MARDSEVSPNRTVLASTRLREAIESVSRQRQSGSALGKTQAIARECLDRKRRSAQKNSVRD